MPGSGRGGKGVAALAAARAKSWGLRALSMSGHLGWDVWENGMGPRGPGLLKGEVTLGSVWEELYMPP